MVLPSCKKKQFIRTCQQGQKNVENKKQESIFKIRIRFCRLQNMFKLKRKICMKLQNSVYIFKTKTRRFFKFKEVNRLDKRRCSYF